MTNSTSPNPVSPPPPGWVPDFEHPTDAGRLMNIVGTVVCVVVVTAFIAVRVYSKTGAVKWYADDYTCIAAYVTLLMYTATIFAMTAYGEGYHAWEVRKENYSEILKWLYASSIIYCPMAYITKVTLLLMTARVFAIKEAVARAIHIFLIALGVAYLPIQFIKTFICTPVRAYWELDVPGAHCLPQRKVFISDLCLAILTDFIVLLLPIPLTWALRMSLRKKIKIMALLGIGGAAAAVVLYRLHLVILFETSTDVTSDFVVLDLTSTIEVAIGLVCSCLPSVNILIEKRRARRNTSRNQPASRWFVDRAQQARAKFLNLTTNTNGTVNGDTVEAESGSYRQTRSNPSSGGSSSKTLKGSSLWGSRLARDTRGSILRSMAPMTNMDIDVDEAMASGQAINIPRGAGAVTDVSSGRSWPGHPAALCPQVSLGQGGPAAPLSSSRVTCEGGNSAGGDAEVDLESGVIMKTVEVSMEMSRVDSIKQEWEGIWDGTTKGW